MSLIILLIHLNSLLVNSRSPYFFEFLFFAVLWQVPVRKNCCGPFSNVDAKRFSNRTPEKRRQKSNPSQPECSLCTIEIGLGLSDSVVGREDDSAIKNRQNVFRPTTVRGEHDCCRDASLHLFRINRKIGDAFSRPLLTKRL